MPVPFMPALAPDNSGLDIDQLAPALRFARQRLRAGIDGLAGLSTAFVPRRGASLRLTALAA